MCLCHEGIICGAFPYSRELHKKKPIAPLDLLGDILDRFDICSVCKDEAGCILAYDEREHDKAHYEAFTANGMSINTFESRQRHHLTFLHRKRASENTRSRDLGLPNAKKKWEGTQKRCLKTTRQCRHIFKIWKRLATKFMTWIHLFAKRFWRDYDLCLLMCVLSSLKLDVLQLQ